MLLTDWMMERTCQCKQPQYGHGTWDDKSLSLSEKVAGSPPSCRACNKWHKSRIYLCCSCGHQYVNWFAHPANGYYPDKGFYCYFCLENTFPTGALWLYRNSNEWLGRQKIPPIDEIVSPEHNKRSKPITYDPETQARLDKFREFLKGI
jgi:hypothetical protein